MKCLVIGGLGFIGSYLVDQLLDYGHSITILDNRQSNVVEPSRWPTVRFISGEDSTICSILDTFDEVYHLASVVGPVAVLNYQGQIAIRILRGVTVTARFCQKKAGRLLYVSTSEVYGGCSGFPLSETDSCVIRTSEPSPRAEYATGKLAAEIALLTSVKDVVIIRPFNVAGPRQSAKGGFVLPRFIEQAKKGENLTVYGDGQAIRAFTHAADIADGIIRAMRSGISPIYNLGNPENKINILGLATMVQSMSPVECKVERFIDPTKLWGPLFREAGDKWPNANLAMTELKWMPTRALGQIVYEAFQ